MQEAKSLSFRNQVEILNALHQVNARGNDFKSGEVLEGFCREFNCIGSDVLRLSDGERPPTKHDFTRLARLTIETLSVLQKSSLIPKKVDSI